MHRETAFQLNHLFFLRGTSAGTLLLHQSFETLFLYTEPTLTRHELGEIERKSVGVVEFEGEFPFN